MTNIKKLIIIMLFVTAIAISTAYFYYNNLNKAEDPRISHIGQMYKNYNHFVRENKRDEALTVLDSIEIEYGKIEHYKNSYEMGVVQINKAAAYLTLALMMEQKDPQKTIFLNTSEEYLEKGLLFYQNWESSYKGLNDKEIEGVVRADFSEISKNKINIVSKRVKTIKLALSEIDRRYSVLFTNLGIIKRHKLQQKEAIECYKKAIDFWDDNYTAKSNLNVLMGKEPIKRNFIQRLFPSGRK